MPGTTSAPSPVRRPLKRLPVFGLYGERRSPVLRMLHVESIDSRSSLYDWEIDAHVHHGLHQLIWLIQGSVHALLDDLWADASGPVALVIPPGVAHAFRFAPHTVGYVLTFDAAMLAEHAGGDIGLALRQLFLGPAVLRLEADDAAVLRWHAIWQALHADMHASQASFTPSADSPVRLWLARSLVWQLAQWCEPTRQSAGQQGRQGRPALYTRWLVLVEEHYLEHWPITAYSAQLGLSAERLNRLVRAEAGRSAQQVVHERLAREACRRLVHEHVPVSQLAFELGFADPAYFSRFFKRHFGKAPGAYRNAAARAVLPNA